jgi:hypothetical protein
VDLKLGANTITVMVTNGGESTTYSIVITRGASSSVLEKLSLSDIALTLDPNMLTYAVRVPSTLSSTTVTASGVPGATVEIPDADADGKVDLKDGPNAIEVVVTSPDGSSKTTYTVTVTRQGAALSDLVLVQGVEGSSDDIALNPAFKSSVTSYTASVGSSVAMVTVKHGHGHGDGGGRRQGDC